MDAFVSGKVVLFSVLIAVIYGFSENDVVIEPKHAVVANGTRMKLTCMINASVPEEYPDTRFWMVHNGKNLTSDPSAPAYKNKNTVAFVTFEAEISSDADASVYTCVVSKSGKWADTHRVEVSGTVLVSTVSQAPVVAEADEETLVTCLRPLRSNMSEIVVTLNKNLSCKVDVIEDNLLDMPAFQLPDLKAADEGIVCYVTTKQACALYGGVANAVDAGAGFEHRLDLIGFQINDTVPHEVCIAFKTSVNNSVNISLRLENGTVVEYAILNIFDGNITSTCFNRTDEVVELVFTTSEGHEFRKDISISLAREISYRRSPVGLVVGIVAAVVVVIVGVVVVVILCCKRKIRCPCQEESETLAHINQGGAEQDINAPGSHHGTEEDVFVDAREDLEAVGKQRKVENTPGVLHNIWENVSSFFKRIPSDTNAVQSNIEDPESEKLNK